MPRVGPVPRLASPPEGVERDLLHLDKVWGPSFIFFNCCFFPKCQAGAPEWWHIPGSALSEVKALSAPC